MNQDNATTTWERTAQASDRGMRLDAFWGRELAGEGISRGRVRGWIEEGCVLVDGRAVTKASLKLKGGEQLRLVGPEGVSSGGGPVPDPVDLDVIHEDAHMAVVHKPAGVTTHPAPSESGSTLVHRLLHRWPDMAGHVSGMEEQRPGIVHRLDKDTSGLIAVARTEADRLALSSAFARREVCKVYLAVVHGVPESESGLIDAPLGRHPSRKTCMAVLTKGGRDARSAYRVVWTDSRSRASLVAVRIFTGRTHQIRVHMAHIGHPLVGDVLYGSREHKEWVARGGALAGLAPRQMLHAFYLALNHPASNEPLEFWREPPEDFQALLRGLNAGCLRIGLTGMPGCGKSTVLGMLRDMGLPVFSADAAVGELYEAGCDGAVMVQQRFGGRFSRDDGSVDKPALFQTMLESDAFRREIMDMVHPMVRHACMEFFAENRDRKLAVAEVPLLVEAGWHREDMVDLCAYVDCPDERRHSIMRESRGLAPETLAAFDSWQWPAERKREACDVIVPNRGTLDELRVGVEQLVTRARELIREREAGFRDRLAALWPELARQIREMEDSA
ncbi:dephospho-CoA kinase [Pseudodesulfovibrio tunisiensis]|uniref:dephospho-CoA kinase n=1 Tax=Pseudodesulfovibrio tunisiensis TaxID=463192 RepID=UPI001FB26223|nr:dephospho-CoA kinase [Pseudodesulfovibrio tunisiensis]